MTRRVVVASKNADKVSEVEAVLDHVGGFEVVRGLDWPEVEETEETLEGNALLKARAVAAATGIDTIADDTGLEVAALGGAPGVITSRYAGPNASYAQNVAKLLSELDGITERSARFRTVVVMVAADGTETVAEGVLYGRIAEEPRGAGGFGYDPVFETGAVTLAEIPPAAKNRISHRALALQALAAMLDAQ
ncbi:MAG: RdgB/HAM1 family non-canonical purine NTP pyrophosphatase [Actinobacteria bacterium]|nr:MAG: RdgB/HAM1 family non-canonical purine NTP pyrophosphatase [Actinomycetota bacterium]RPI20966.1 MAG: RdgB/HAM1 family non-canonical purine NTP pyrophosphatase [Actinomycetota bacterium]